MNKKQLKSLQAELANAERECKNAKFNAYIANCSGAVLSVITTIAALKQNINDFFVFGSMTGIIFMYGKNSSNVHKIIQKDIKKIRRKINIIQKQH